MFYKHYSLLRNNLSVKFLLKKTALNFSSVTSLNSYLLKILKRAGLKNGIHIKMNLNIFIKCRYKFNDHDFLKIFFFYFTNITKIDKKVTMKVHCIRLKYSSDI